MNLFVAGINKGVGKTVLSSILVEALKADYWKPIQNGDKKGAKLDSKVIQRLISNPISKTHKSVYKYNDAEDYALNVDIQNIKVPCTLNNIVIEGATGLMVPLNRQVMIIDLIDRLNADVVLVSRNYSGSINHSILSAEALLKRGIPVKGIIFNGKPKDASESIILEYTGLEYLGSIPLAEKLDKDFIKQYAEYLKPSFQMATMQ